MMIDLLSIDLQQIAGENFNYILLYFERILSEYTLNKDLWTLFINYTENLCKKKDEKLAIYKKSVKNCPGVATFWLAYLRELEKDEDTNPE